MRFDWLEDGGDTNLYGVVEDTTTDAAVSIYHLLAKIGIFASLIAMFIAAILLIINATSGGEKLADAKKYVVQVLIVSILIFGASGLVLMVAEAGF